MELVHPIRSGMDRVRSFVGGVARSVVSSEQDTLHKLDSDINAITRARMADAYDESCVDPDALYSQHRAAVVAELQVLSGAAKNVRQR